METVYILPVAARFVARYPNGRLVKSVVHAAANVKPTIRDFLYPVDWESKIDRPGGFRDEAANEVLVQMDNGKMYICYRVPWLDGTWMRASVYENHPLIRYL